MLSISSPCKSYHLLILVLTPPPPRGKKDTQLSRFSAGQASTSMLGLLAPPAFALALEVYQFLQISPSPSPPSFPAYYLMQKHNNTKDKMSENPIKD